MPRCKVVSQHSSSKAASFEEQKFQKIVAMRALPLVRCSSSNCSTSSGANFVRLEYLGMVIRSWICFQFSPFADHCRFFPRTVTIGLSLVVWETGLVLAARSCSFT